MRQFIAVGYITLVDYLIFWTKVHVYSWMKYICTHHCPEITGMLLWDPVCVLQYWLSLCHITVWFLPWQAIIIPMLPLTSPLFGAWLAWPLYSKWTA